MLLKKASIIDGFTLLLDQLSAQVKRGHNYRLPYSKEHKGIINILGTGPSLKDSIKTIKSVEAKGDCFAMNDFALSDFYEMLSPLYYIFLDHSYFLPDESIPERDLKIRTSVFKSIIEKTSWNMNVIIPSSVFNAKVLSDLSNNKFISFIPVCFADLSLIDSPSYFRMLEKNKAASFQNVLAAAIYVSINLGYDEVRLFGAEHSWTKDMRVNNNNQVCTIYKHFYEDEEKLVPWMTSNNKPFTMDKLMYSFYRIFRGYKLLAKYADLHSCKVINYTPNSFIDAFERKALIK